MYPMPIQIPPLFPKRPGLLGDKRPPALPTWNVAGSVLDSANRGVPDVLIKVVNKETNVQTHSTRTDADGRFTVKVPTNDLGYRVTPSKYPYAICPGYQDIRGNADLRFSAIGINKDEAGSSGGKG